MKTLQLLKDYASTTENTGLTRMIETLELEIEEKIQSELNEQFYNNYPHND
tara:strand:- start:5998 stop:6150 length:153 start_codon:yes stop_codon:yes gene_type:complete